MTLHDADGRAPGGDRRPALLIVAHGERGGAGTNALVHAVARRLRDGRRFATVEVGFIRSEPSLEAAAAHIHARRLVIYPLFMSDGYYVRNAIPERLGISQGRDRTGRAVDIALPLGLDPALPTLIADTALQAAARTGIEPAKSRLLLVAHGSSKSGYSAAAARKIAGRVATLAGFADVGVAFLEEEPMLVTALASLPGPALVLGLFAGDGLHGGEDLPQAIAQSRRNDLHFAGSLGTQAVLPDLIEQRLAQLA